jgi:hypothetical protein
MNDDVAAAEIAGLVARLITLPEWPHRIVTDRVPNPGEIVFEANRYYCRPPE